MLRHGPFYPSLEFSMTNVMISISFKHAHGWALLQSMTSNSLLLMEPPHCKTCLDLSWARIPDDSCDEPRECRLKIPYQSLLNSKDCQICTVITYAITEFGKTLDAYDEKFYQFLQLSQVRIFLRDGWTTRVSLWRGEDLLPEPYLELEIFTIDG